GSDKKEESETSSDSKESDSDDISDSDSDVTADDLGVTVITMPLLSDTMTEGVIAEWNFKVGDEIKSDDAIADVETDKATMEVTAYADGTLLYIGLEKGEAAKVNDIIAIVGPKGTDITPLLNKKNKPSSEAKAAEVKDAPKEDDNSSAKAGSSEESVDSDDSRVKASPLAKKLAKEKGIKLSDVKGSAEGGRIVKKDIEDYKPAEKAVSAAP